MSGKKSYVAKKVELFGKRQRVLGIEHKPASEWVEWLRKTQDCSGVA